LAGESAGQIGSCGGKVSFLGPRVLLGVGLIFHLPVDFVHLMAINDIRIVDSK